MADKSQLAIEQQINQAIAARAALIEQNKAGLVDQIALAQELCRALECRELDGYQERMAEVRDGLMEAAEASGELSNSTEETSEAMKKASDSAEGWKAAGVGAFIAVKNVASTTLGIFGSIGNVITTGVMGAFNLLRSGFQAWNSMIDGMLGMANELYNGTSALRQAMEDLRAEFGDLAKGEAKAISGAFREISGRGATLAGTGLRLSRVFGSGSEGSAAKLKFFQEIASDMGPVFSRLSGEFDKAAKQIVNAAKGLGLSGKSIASLTIAGRAHGKTMKQALSEVNKQVVQVSKAYGTNIKLTGQMLDQMIQAPEIFGTNTKEMLKTSVAAQKLGVSIDTLTKVTSVFDDFESGAKAAGELAAQFGITVDAMDMMTATPAEQVTMLKDALQASGQSFEDMSRQEKARLADLTNMDMMELQNLMDPTNSFDLDAMNDVDKGVSAATKATIAQTEANRELAKVMERVVEQGQRLSGKGGLFGTFSDGVLTGIMNSKEFRHILKNIHEVFRIVHRAGVQVGHMLGELFGSDGPLHVVSDLFNNLFNPVWMQQKMKEVQGFFRKFVDSAKSGGTDMRKAMSVLVEDLVGAFFGSGGSGFLDKFLQGLEDAFDFIGSSIISMLPYLMNGLSELFKLGVKALSGDLQKPEFGGTLAKDGLFPMIQEALADPALTDAWDGLGKSFLAFIDKFWAEYGDTISDVLGGILATIIAAALIKSVGIVFATGMVLRFGKLFADGMTKMMGGAVAQNVPKGDVPQKIADLAAGVSSAIEELGKVSLTDVAKAALIIAAIGGGFYLALKGMLAIAKEAMAAGMEPTMLAAVAAATFVVAKVIEGVAAAAQAAEQVKNFKKSLPTLAAMLLLSVGVMAAVSLIMTQVVSGLSGLTPPDPSTIEAFSKVTMTILIATAAIAAIGAGLAILVTLASGPQALILAAMIGAALVVFAAVAGLIYMLVDTFGSMNPQKAKTASTAATAAGKIIEQMMIVLAAIGENIGGVSLDPESFNNAVANMVKIVDTIADKFMPAMQRAADAITGDPESIRNKLAIVTDMMRALAPIAAMYEAALKVADMEGATPAMVNETIQKLSDGVTGILDTVKGMVTDMVKSVKSFSVQDIKKAAGVAQLIDAVSGLMSGLTGPLTGFEDTVLKTYSVQKTSDGVLTDTYGSVQTGERLGRTAGQKMLEFIENTGRFMGSIGDKLQPLVDAVLTLDLGKLPPEKLKAHTESVAAIFKSLASLMDIFASLKDNNPTRIEGRFNNLVALLAPGGQKSAIWGKMESLANYMAKFSTSTNAEAAGKGAVSFLKTMEDTIKITNALGRSSITAEPEDVGTKLDKISKLAAVFRARKHLNASHFAPMVGVFEGFGTLNEGVRELGWYDTDSISETIDKIVSLQPKIDTFATSVKAGMWQPLTDVVNAYSELSLELGKASNIVDIESTLNRVGQALKVDGQKVTVERGDVQITVNLSVNMQASKLSQVLVQNLLVAKGQKYKAPVGMEPPA